ncbi:MAG TPA: ABC transporter substrate-binding protein, partial [Acetobacteraceae bacterium]
MIEAVPRRLVAADPRLAKPPSLGNARRLTRYRWPHNGMAIRGEPPMSRLIRCAVAVLAVCLTIGGVAQAETIRLGAILPLTGPGALIGTQQMRGIQFAIDQVNAKGGVNGNKIEVLFEDNQAKPDQSILSFNKLVDLQKVPL